MRRAGRSIAAVVILWPMPAWQGAASVSAVVRPEAEMLISAGHWKRARSILEPEAKAGPENARICYLLAEVKASFKQFDAALPLAQHAVDLESKNSNYHLELGKIYGELAARASFMSAASLALKFRKEVEIAIQIDPHNLQALDSMMQFKFQAPSMMGGNKDEARWLAETITALNASEGYLDQAELEKDPAKMETDYLKAVQANPRNYDALTALAKFYSEAPHTNRDEAVKLAQAAAGLDPGRIEAYWILVRIFASRGRWGNLENVLAAAEQRVPDDLRPFYEAAQALRESGTELPRAESCAKKYLTQEPEGDEPDIAEAHRLLGLIYAGEDRYGEARAEIRTALQLRPGFKAAKEDLKKLGN